jgi:hypothetical protein
VRAALSASTATTGRRRTSHQHWSIHVPITVGPVQGINGVLTSVGGSPIVPADFGADPTGTKDSTAAMQAAMSALLSRRGPPVSMASNITDLGGATLDLSGGSYLISAPLVIPPR